MNRLYLTKLSLSNYFCPRCIFKNNFNWKIVEPIEKTDKTLTNVLKWMYVLLLVIYIKMNTLLRALTRAFILHRSLGSTIFIQNDACWKDRWIVIEHRKGWWTVIVKTPMDQHSAQNDAVRVVSKQSNEYSSRVADLRMKSLCETGWVQ